MNYKEFCELIELRELRSRTNLTESDQFKYTELYSKFSNIGDEHRELLLQQLEEDNEFGNQLNQSLINRKISSVNSENSAIDDLIMSEKADQEAKLTKIETYIIKLNHRPQVKLDKLDSNNWKEWRLTLMDGLKYYDLHFFVNGTFTNVVHSNETFKRYDDVCKNIIQLGLCPLYRELVLEEDTAQQTYDKLEYRFEGPSVLRMVSAVGLWYSAVVQFESMEKLIHSLREMIKVFNRFKTESNADALWCAFFLAALPNHYSHLRTTLSNKKETSLDDYFSSALQEERFRAGNADKKKALVHNLNHRNRQQSYNVMNNKNRGIECFYCHGDHKKVDCPKLKQRNAPENNRNNNGSGQRSFQNDQRNYNQSNRGGQAGHSNGNRQSNQSNRSNNNGQSFNRNVNNVNRSESNVFDTNNESNNPPPHSNGQNRLNMSQNNNSNSVNANVQFNPLNNNMMSSFGNRNQRAMFNNSFLNGDDDDPVTPAYGILYNLMSSLSSRIQEFQNRSVICNGNLHTIRDDTYYMDTGATDHFLKNVSICYDYADVVTSEHLVTAEGAKVPVNGIGQAYLYSTLNTKLRLKDCIICPKLKANFISASRLDLDDNIWVLTGDRKVRVIYEGNIVMVGSMTADRLYEMHVAVETPKMNFTMILRTNEERVIYLHRALAHMPFDKMRKLESELEIKITNAIQCIECMQSKAKRAPFPVGSIKTNRPLQMIHMDLSGCIRIANRDRYQYFLLIIDDFSRYKVAALLQSKSQVYQMVQEYKSYFENQLDTRLKVIRSDNGTEFTNQQMKELCSSDGIQQQFSCPRTPEQNSVAERGIGVVKQTVRSLLLTAQLGASFWPYALMYAIFILNRIPNAAIGFRVPYELFFNKKVSYNWIKLFGSRVVYKEDSPDNTFSPTGEAGIFLGYPLHVKGFYVYSPKLRKVIINRNVEFLNYSCGKQIEDDCVFDHVDLRINDLYDEDETETGLQLRSDSCEMNYTVNQFNDSPKPGDNPSSNKLDESIGQADQITKTNETDVSDLIKQMKNPSSTLYIGDLGQDENGEIKLNKKQKKEFVEKYPNVNLRFVRGTNSKGPGKVSIYRINNIIAPKTFRNAMSSPEAVHWKEATDEEYNSLVSNDTWDLVQRPKNVFVLPVMWIFAIKLCIKGTIERYKARLVVLGNLQKIGRDFNESYAPVVNELTFRIFLSIAVRFKLLIHQIDVKTAFLNADIVGDVYVEQPPGYKINGKENFVYKLKKALYGLKQSALQWNIKLNEIMNQIGFKRALSDQCLYYANFNDGFALIIVYVDDLLIACSDIDLMNRIKSKLKSLIEISDKGVVKHFLNLDIDYDFENQRLYISQSHYIENLLRETGMCDSNGAKTPVVPGTDVFGNDGKPFEDVHWYQMVMGRLIYLATHSRSDICFMVSRLCAFMHQPKVNHISMLRRILKYLKHTKHYRLCFSGNQSTVNLFCDADFGNDESTSRSITGVACFVFGNLVNWFSRKQKRVSNSTCQAEVLSIVDATLEAEFIHRLFKEINIFDLNEIVLYNDNNSARLTILGSGDFARNKHYRTSINLVKEVVQMGFLKIKHCSSEEMIADYLTKPLTESQFVKLVSKSNVGPSCSFIVHL